MVPSQDTKMSLNSKISANKFSTAEKTMNKYLLFYLGLLFAQGPDSIDVLAFGLEKWLQFLPEIPSLDKNKTRKKTRNFSYKFQFQNMISSHF